MIKELTIFGDRAKEGEFSEISRAGKLGLFHLPLFCPTQPFAPSDIRAQCPLLGLFPPLSYGKPFFILFL